MARSAETQTLKAKEVSWYEAPGVSLNRMLQEVSLIDSRPDARVHPETARIVLWCENGVEGNLRKPCGAMSINLGDCVEERLFSLGKLKVATFDNVQIALGGQCI